MPFYEYHCDACGNRFSERRAIANRDTDVACPNCSAVQVERSVSVVAAFSHGEDGTVRNLGSSQCGGCSGGSCTGCGSAHSRN